MATEYYPFDEDEDARNVAEQQKDMEERQQYLQMTYEQLRRKIMYGTVIEADTVSLDILARDLGLKVISVTLTQPVDYPLNYGATD